LLSIQQQINLSIMELPTDSNFKSTSIPQASFALEIPNAPITELATMELALALVIMEVLIATPFFNAWHVLTAVTTVIVSTEPAAVIKDIVETTAQHQPASY